MFKDEQYNVDNGITLCKSCHREFHHRYGFKKYNYVHFNEFLCELRGEIAMNPNENRQIKTVYDDILSLQHEIVGVSVVC